MKKFALAAICTFALVGFVLADEFSAVVMKVDGKNVTYFKTKGFGGGFGGGKKGGKGGGGGKGAGGFKGPQKDGDAVTTATSASVKVAKGNVMFEDMKLTYSAGDPIEGGLTADIFKTIDQEKGVAVRITVADDGADKGKITQVLITGGKKKGG